MKRISEMTERILVEEYPEIDYVLLYLPKNPTPWVAAWDYDSKTESWSQGHYFQTLEESMNYIRGKLS